MSVPSLSAACAKLISGCVQRRTAHAATIAEDAIIAARAALRLNNVKDVAPNAGTVKFAFVPSSRTTVDTIVPMRLISAIGVKARWCSSMWAAAFTISNLRSLTSLSETKE